MIDKYLIELGLTETAVTAKELNGKFIAILRHDGKSGDPRIITVPGKFIISDGDNEMTLQTGDILAHENPIYVQEIAERLYPEYSGANNKGGKHIQFCPIPKNLNYY